MPTYGITSAGFVAKTFDDLKTDYELDFKSVFGNSIDLSPQSNFGQIIGIAADRDSELWELATAIYNAFDPDTATEDALDVLAAITGTYRKDATKSKVSVTATGTAGTLVPAGKVFSVSGTGARFVTLADATIGPGTPGTVTIACESEDIGPIVAASGTLSIIETPVAGLYAVSNPLDATLGAYVESDVDLRARRSIELRTAGNAALDAVRANVLALTGVNAVTVFENTSFATDGDGIPPHSIEVLVGGGSDADIRQAIFASKAAGIGTYGNTTGTVTDSQGTIHTINFSRATLLPVYVRVGILVDANTFPIDGVSQIASTLANYGTSVFVGKDVVASALIAQVFKVSGVLDVPYLYIGLSPTPTTSSTISVNLRQLASFDTSRVTVDPPNYGVP